MPPIEFRAPWSRSLKKSTIVGAAIVIALIVALSLMNITAIWKFPVMAILILYLLLSLILSARGYELTEHEIRIKRIGWNKRLPLDTLQSVDGKADAMQGALRIRANIGMFSYTGLYWSRELKLFRAYATDPSRAAILRYPKKKIVITPHDPQQFIMRARTYLKTGSGLH